jgi:hypothetical protein
VLEHREVGGEGERNPRAGRDAVDRADHGLVDPGHAAERGVQVEQDVAQDVGRPVQLAVKDGDVSPGAECAPAAREQHGTHTGVVSGVVEGAPQLYREVDADGVHSVGPVQRDLRDAVALLVADGLGLHRGALPSVAVESATIARDPGEVNAVARSASRASRAGRSDVTVRPGDGPRVGVCSGRPLTLRARRKRRRGSCEEAGEMARRGEGNYSGPVSSGSPAARQAAM